MNTGFTKLVAIPVWSCDQFKSFWIFFMFKIDIDIYRWSALKLPFYSQMWRQYLFWVFSFALLPAEIFVMNSKCQIESWLIVNKQFGYRYIKLTFHIFNIFLKFTIWLWLYTIYFHISFSIILSIHDISKKHRTFYLHFTHICNNQC